MTVRAFPPSQHIAYVLYLHPHVTVLFLSEMAETILIFTQCISGSYAKLKLMCASMLSCTLVAVGYIVYVTLHGFK